MGHRKQKHKLLKSKRGKIFGLSGRVCRKGEDMSVADIDKITNPAGTLEGKGVNRINNFIDNVFGRVSKPYVKPAPDYWEAPEPKVLKDHALAPVQHDVTFTPLVKAKIDTLMSVYPNIEWLCYLSGVREGDNTIVNDIIIPVQSVTSVRVDKIELENMGSLPIVGVMHSHHGMGNGFSGTDDAYINANHLLSLCISHGGINGQFRWNSPEGDQVILNAVVQIKYDFDFDVNEFKKTCNENITAIRYVHINNYSYTPVSNRAYNFLDDEFGAEDLKEVVTELVVPKFCPKCASINISVVDDEGWFCNNCGEDYYLTDDILNFNTGFGFDAAPQNEQHNFDGIDGNWSELELEDKYPVPSNEWERAESLGYIQCEECLDYYKPLEVVTGNHPADHVEGDPKCDLCKDCFVSLKYSVNRNKRTDQIISNIVGWDTKKVH